MKNGLWLSQRQVRWLIVLLALLPLIPSGLLVQMLVQNTQRDYYAAISEMSDTYREQLGQVAERYSADRETGSGEVFSGYLRQVFGEEITMVVASPDGRIVEGDPESLSGLAIVYRIAGGGLADWTVSLDRIPDFSDHLVEQRRETFWHAVAILLGVVVVAGGVWFTVHRRLRVDELRSDLLTTVSHEMKTPVAASKVLLETLLDGNADEQVREDYTELLMRENDRLAELTEQFLTYSLLERGRVNLQREECSLGDLVEEQVALMRPRFESRGGALDWDRVEEVRLPVDPQAIKVILANLLENAVKYGGEPPRAQVALEVTPEEVSVSVTDEGEGIRKEDRRAVFRRFYRGNAELRSGSSGVGLGLAISRRFARLMNGAIRIGDSEQGARVVLTLPRPMEGGA